MNVHMIWALHIPSNSQRRSERRGLNIKLLLFLLIIFSVLVHIYIYVSVSISVVNNINAYCLFFVPKFTRLQTWDCILCVCVCVCVCVMFVYVCGVIGFVEWFDKGYIYIFYIDEMSFEMCICLCLEFDCRPGQLSWGDPVWLTGH